MSELQVAAHFALKKCIFFLCVLGWIYLALSLSNFWFWKKRKKTKKKQQTFSMWENWIIAVKRLDYQKMAGSNCWRDWNYAYWLWQDICRERDISCKLPGFVAKSCRWRKKSRLRYNELGTPEKMLFIIMAAFRYQSNLFLKFYLAVV